MRTARSILRKYITNKKVQHFCDKAQFMLRKNCMNGMTLSSSLVTPLLAVIIKKLRAFCYRLVPVGYQDENGFHKGEKSRTKQ